MNLAFLQAGHVSAREGIDMRAGEAEITSTVAATLRAVLDEHAELSEILALIQNAADLQLLGGLRVRLGAHLEAHFLREEESGFLALLVTGSVPDEVEPARRGLGGCGRPHCP